MNSSSSKSNKSGGQSQYNQDKHYKNTEQDDSNSSHEGKSKNSGSNKYKRKQVEIKLFVGQIPKTWEESDLKTFFEKYGEIVKVQVIRDKNNQHKGCAFVLFASILCANIAIEALKSTKLPGMQNPIQVKWADNEPDRLGIRQDQDYVLYVAHIPKNATESEIRGVFENYGNVKEVDIPKDQTGYSRGYVFVKFDNIEQAILSKQALHEKQILNNQTQPLVVKFYDPKKKQNTGPASSGQQSTIGSNNNNMSSNNSSGQNSKGNSTNNNSSYNNNSGSTHHSSRDNNGQQQGYYPSQSSSYPSSSQPIMNMRSSDGYSHNRDRESGSNANNYNQNSHHNNNSSSQSGSQPSYRGGGSSGNYYQDGNKRDYQQNNNNNNSQFPPRDNMNLSGSGHFDQAPSSSYDNYQNNPSSFKDQYGGAQNPQSTQKNNGNFQYSSSYPTNQQIGNNGNYQFNQTYNNGNNPAQGNPEFNYQNQPQPSNEYIPPPSGQNSYPPFNEQYQNHGNNNYPHQNTLPNQIQGTQAGTNNGNNNYPPFYPPNQNENQDPYGNPVHSLNTNEQINYADNQHQQRQPPLVDSHQLQNPQVQQQQQQQQPLQVQQHPQQQQLQQQQQQIPPQYNVNQPIQANPNLNLQESVQSNAPYQEPSLTPSDSNQQSASKVYIKYYTTDKVPYFYDTQTSATSYDQPPLGSVIYNPDGTQEHVQPESIEQLQKFQQETGMTENKELEILSQKTTGPAGANLFIFHLPNDYRDSDLLRLFKKFGDLLSARVITRPDGSSKGYGFVSYTHPDGAQQAIQSMNGLQVGKKKLKVEVKKGQGDGDLPLSVHQSSFQPF